MWLLAFLVSLEGVCWRAAAEIYEVDGKKIEVSLHFEKPSMILGEPTWFTFRVQNHSAENLEVLVGGDYRNAVGRPNSFKIKVVGSDGSTVSQPPVTKEMGGMFGPQKLPANGKYEFKLFMPHWATFEKPGRYTINCVRQLSLSKEGSFSSADRKSFQMDTQTSESLEVLPADEKAMGAVIAALGKKLRDGTWDEKENAARTMDSIKDPRVIPHFRHGLKTRYYSLMFFALWGVAKFPGDDAFEILKAGMALTGADVDYATTPRMAAQSAELLRAAAASGLARSPHPDAIPLLLKHCNDPSEGVRTTILSVLGRLDTPESLAMIEEMTKDKSEWVSKQAKRYLEMRTKPKAP